MVGMERLLVRAAWLYRVPYVVEVGLMCACAIAFT